MKSSISNDINKAILDNDLEYLRELTDQIVNSSERAEENLIQKVLNYNESEKERCFICCRSVKNMGGRTINICRDCEEKIL